MNEQPFVKLCKEAIVDYHNNHRDKFNPGNGITVDDVYVVWLCKILKNNKVLLVVRCRYGVWYWLL